MEPRSNNLHRNKTHWFSPRRRLNHRDVKDSFNRKLTTIAKRYMKSRYYEGRRAKRKKVDEFGVAKSYYTLSSSQIENEPYSSRKPIKL